MVASSLKECKNSQLFNSTKKLVLLKQKKQPLPWLTPFGGLVLVI
jgi:hypothetical protein